MVYDFDRSLVTKKRCKAKCPHRRDCHKWEDHVYDHDFRMLCRRCDAAFPRQLRLNVLTDEPWEDDN